MKHLKRLHIATVVAVVGLGSCSRDQVLQDNAAFPGQNKPVSLRLSYELEAVTHREITTPGSNESFTFVDDIASEPVASRQAIDIALYQDGTADYLVEERKPEIILLPSPFEGVPPNDIPPITKTRISAGMAFFYDATGSLVYQHPMEEDYTFLEQATRLAGEYDWATEAKAQGATLETLKNGNLLIRKQLPPTPDAQQELAARTAGGRYTEEVINPNLNLLLGGSLYEASGQLVSRVFYKYDYLKDKQQWQPKMMYYEEYGSNETTNSQYISKTTYYFENYSLQRN